jgi:hypothetical protein
MSYSFPECEDPNVSHCYDTRTVAKLFKFTGRNKTAMLQYQPTETNMMAFYSVYQELRPSTCVEQYFLILRRRYTSGT